MGLRDYHGLPLITMDYHGLPHPSTWYLFVAIYIYYNNVWMAVDTIAASGYKSGMLWDGRIYGQ